MGETRTDMTSFREYITPLKCVARRPQRIAVIVYGPRGHGVAGMQQVGMDLAAVHKSCARLQLAP